MLIFQMQPQMQSMVNNESRSLPVQNTFAATTRVMPASNVNDSVYIHESEALVANSGIETNYVYPSNLWILDTGASSHISSTLKNLRNTKKK